MVIGETGDVEVSETEYLTEENTFGNDGVQIITSTVDSNVLHANTVTNFYKRDNPTYGPYFICNQERLAEKQLKSLKIWFWEGGNTYENFKLYLINLPNKANNRVLVATDCSSQYTTKTAWENAQKVFITLDTTDCPEGPNEFMLDGSDPRVTINPEFVRDGYAFIPNRYFVGLIEPANYTAETAIGVLRQIQYGNSSTGTEEGFVYWGSSGVTKASTYTFSVEFKSYVGNEETVELNYEFDKRLTSNPVTYKRPKQITTAVDYSYGTNRGAQGGVYYLEDISAMTGQYLTHFGVRPGAGVHPIVIRYAKCATNGKLTGGTTYSALIDGGKEFCTINAPAMGLGQKKPMIFALDGSDDRVTLSQDALADFDSEHGGFLIDGTWTFGIDDRANTTGIPSPNATDTGDGALGDGTVTFIASGASASPVSVVGNLKFATITTSTGKFGTVGNSDLCLEMFTTEEVSQEVNSNIIQGIIDQLSKDFQTDSPLKDKYITIIGDSISTWDGWNNVYPCNPSAAVYYPKPEYGMNDVHQSYWMKLIDRTGAKLLVNQSWSGSCCTNTRTQNGPVCAALNSSYERTARCGKDGIDPDYIVINIGTNDFNRMGSDVTNYGPSGMGVWNGRGNVKYPDISLTPTTFREAYAVMLGRLKKNYPLAKIFCCTCPAGDASVGGTGDGTYNEINLYGVSLVEFNDAIREIASAYGCRIVELAMSGLNFYTLSTLYCDNRLHPNEAGMELYYAAIRHALETQETTAGTALPRNSVRVLQGVEKPIIPEFTGSDITELKAELNKLLQALEIRGVIDTDDSKYVTLNTIKYRIVHSLLDMTLTDNAIVFYNATTTAGSAAKRPYRYDGGRCAAIIDGDVTSDEDGVSGYILEVNGGETITYNPDPALISGVADFAYAVVELDSTGAVPSGGSKAASWLNANLTLQSSTKYALIYFRTNATFHKPAVTTKAQKQMMLEALTIA